MKKLITVLALVLSSSAFAGAGVTYEFERERTTDSHTYSDTIKVAPYYKLENGVKFDVMFAGSRDDGTVSGNRNPIDSSIEARVQKLWELVPNFKLGLRTSLGEKFNSTATKSGLTQDFGYYTIEPKATYSLGDVTLATAMRYRDSFIKDATYQTRTWKYGADYAVTKSSEVGFRYLVKRGDEKTNGVEFTFSQAF